MLDPDQEYHLLHGQGLIVGFGDDIDGFTAAWDIHAARLTAEFIRDNPGRRPFGWWLLEHERERPLNPKFPLPDCATQYREEAERHSFGFLHSEVYAGGQQLQEPEHVYLQRCGLLTAEELQ